MEVVAPARGDWVRRRLGPAIAVLVLVAALTVTPLGSGLGLVGDAHASSDVDPCGTANESTTVINPALGFNTGSGPAALVCSYKDIGFPPFLPEDVPIAAPDAANIDPGFKNGFPFMIGPDGAEVSYTAISTEKIITQAAEGAGASLAVSGLAAWLFPPISSAAVIGGAVAAAVIGALEEVIAGLISEEEAMQGADWDWSVPSNTGTGDWYSWFTWSGTGGYVDDTPAISPSSVDPAIVNWYVYAIDDPYYQTRPPVPYVRVYMGATRVAMEQGPGITAKAEELARNGTCTPVPSCFGAGATSARPVKARPAIATAARGKAGRAIHPPASAKGPVTGTARNDEFRAEKGDIEILAGAGHDQALGGRGDNRLSGGGGHDELTAFEGGDRLKGNSGHDVLQGGPGSDASIGNSGSDSLFDAEGSDFMLAGRGDDRIVVRDGQGDDVVHCGPGTDMVIADPGDLIARAAGASSSASRPSKVPVGAFTRSHTPSGSTCERVYSSVHMPPREPPSIGHPAGRPPEAAEPPWPVFD